MTNNITNIFFVAIFIMAFGLIGVIEYSNYIELNEYQSDLPIIKENALLQINDNMTDFQKLQVIRGVCEVYASQNIESCIIDLKKEIFVLNRE